MNLSRFMRVIALVLLVSSLAVNVVDAKSQKLKVLYTNDVHGRLCSFKSGLSNYDKELGGVARRKTLIDRLKQESDTKNILLLDAGDIAQGTIFFNLYNGLPDMKFMNMLGYDAAAAGNHEFDKGSKVFAKMVEVADFPVLCCNLKFDKKSPLYGKLKPYVIKDFGNLKVGIIGVMTPEVKIVSYVNENTKVLDAVETVQKYIDELDPQTDLIIILSHLGFYDDVVLAKKIRNADIIVGGHTHNVLNKPETIKDLDGKPVNIYQAGDFGKYLGDLTLVVSNDRVKKSKNVLHEVNMNIEPDKEIQAVILPLKKQKDVVARKNIGTSESYINVIKDEVRTKETTGGNFLADAIKEHFPDVDIVVQNGGGVRSDRIIHPGGLSLLDVIELHPFGDDVVLFELSGKDLKTILERSVHNLPYSFAGFLQVSGLSFIVDVSKTPQKMNKDFTEIVQNGDRINHIMVNGKPVDPEKYYKIAAKRFLINAGDGYITLKDKAKNITGTGLTVADILEEYLKKNSPVCPKVEDRIQVINIPKSID